MLKKLFRSSSSAIPYYEFSLFQPSRGGLRHAVFTRNSKTVFTPNTHTINPKPIQKILETDARPFLLKKQLHGTDAWIIKEEDKRSELAQNGDILITALSETPLVIRIADCASILLFDPEKKIIANVHAGWRGLAQRIIRHVLQTLNERFGCRSENILAAISPTLGPCCSQFSNPKEELPKFLHQYILEENMVDLWSIIEGQLRECGVLKDHVENPRVCTMCNSEEFFSYRRDGDLGRFGTAIMLK